MRDDLDKLPLPPEAKRYARRKGLASMKRQPQDFLDMCAAVTNQKDRQYGFKNKDDAGKVPHTFKESVDRTLRLLLDAEDDDVDFKDLYDTEQHVFRVYPTGYSGSDVDYNFQVPDWSGMKLVNKKSIGNRFHLPSEIKGVEQHMRTLARLREYPAGAVFVTPWGRYSINQDKTVTAIYGQ